MPRDPLAVSDGGISRLGGSLTRLDDRVRRWSAARWRAPGGDGRARTEVAYRLAVALAELGRRAGNGAPPVAPPQLAPHAIADQLALLGRELLRAPNAETYAEEAAAAVLRASEAL